MTHFQVGFALLSGTGLELADPFVLGPIAAFIFTIFVSEVVVPGKTYRREVEENKRLRELTEKVVPLAEKMILATEDMMRVTAGTARALEDFLRFWDEGRRR